MKHPAACPYCGGTNVNAVSPDVTLRDAILQPNGSVLISVETEGGEWDFGEMLFCHTCASTYVVPAGTPIEWGEVDPAPAYDPSIPKPGDASYIGIDVVWVPVTTRDFESLKLKLVDCARLAEGDSNDAEIDALTDALEDACFMLGIDTSVAAEVAGIES